MSNLKLNPKNFQGFLPCGTFFSVKLSIKGKNLYGNFYTEQNGELAYQNNAVSTIEKGNYSKAIKSVIKDIEASIGIELTKANLKVA